MIILSIIYSLIILYIITRGLYISIKPLNNIQKIESLQDSIFLIALPFYLNQGKINLFAFLINFFLISLFGLSLVSDLFFNCICFCMDDNNNDIDMEIPFPENVEEFIDIISGELDIFSMNGEDDDFFLFHFFLGSPYTYFNNIENSLPILIEEMSHIESRINANLGRLIPGILEMDNISLSVDVYTNCFTDISININKILLIQESSFLKIITHLNYVNNVKIILLYNLKLQSDITSNIISYICLDNLKSEIIYDFYRESLLTHNFLLGTKFLINENLSKLERIEENYLNNPINQRISDDLNLRFAFIPENININNDLNTIQGLLNYFVQHFNQDHDGETFNDIYNDIEIPFDTVQILNSQEIQIYNSTNR